jgi:hypothetical protein
LRCCATGYDWVSSDEAQATHEEAPVKPHGQRAAGHWWFLAVWSLISVMLVGCCSSAVGETQTGAASAATPNAQLLTWAPPECGGGLRPCEDLYLGNTGSHQTLSLDDSTDYKVHLPANGPLVGGITIAGGHNVQIIGGEIDLTYPCSNDASDCTGIYIAKSSPGSVFVEGVWIHNPSTIGTTCPGGASSAAQTCSTGHGIDVNTADNGAINVNTITLENIRIDGISGCSGFHDHADVFQPYQAPGDTIQVDRMTGVTNCQGLQLDPDLAYSKWHQFPRSITIKNTNVDASYNPYRKDANGNTWWLTYGLTCISGPIALSNDYFSGPPADPAAASVWPYPGCGAQNSHGVVSWTGVNVQGVIRNGTPIGGDFVPAGAVGLGYRSPGYQQ